MKLSRALHLLARSSYRQPASRAPIATPRRIVCPRSMGHTLLIKVEFIANKELALSHTAACELWDHRPPDAIVTKALFITLLWYEAEGFCFMVQG